MPRRRSRLWCIPVALLLAVVVYFSPKVFPQTAKQALYDS
jgi:hypothetical protein